MFVVARIIICILIQNLKRVVTKLSFFCRQRALKALDERLSKVEQPLSSWDDTGSSSQDELPTPSPSTTTTPGTSQLEAVMVEKPPPTSSSSSLPHQDTKLSTPGSSETVVTAVKIESV